MKYKIIPVTSFNQNCSLIWCEERNEAALLDPGGEINLLHQVIRSSRLILKKIFLTHGHIDHVGVATEISKYYNVPIIGPHCGDQWLLDNIAVQCTMLNFSIIPSVIPDYWLVDNEIVEVGNLKFHVLHCPGHSPGHVIFWSKKYKFIFMGDILFKGNIGRTDLPGGNMEDLVISIKKLIYLGDDIVFLPGHGSISTLGHERHFNNFVKDFLHDRN